MEDMKLFILWDGRQLFSLRLPCAVTACTRQTCCGASSCSYGWSRLAAQTLTYN